MIYRKLDDIIAHHYQTSSKALLLMGARQVGKSYAIRKYGQSHFAHYVEINFLRQPEFIGLLQGVRTLQDLLLRLSAFVQEPLIKGETLVFFDEVQVYPDIMTWVKFLVEDGSYRYALSGSLLGIQLRDVRSIPVGYMSEQQVYPLDFEEFIRAVGVNDEVIRSVQQAWQTRTPVDGYVHTKLMQLFNLYLIVGGMPEAVQAYIDTNNLQTVWQVQHSIIALYKQDIAQYDPANKLYIRDIFALIPSELNAQNKRFILKSLNEHIKFTRHENDFVWMREAGVALPAFNVEKPCSPLQLNKQYNLFKLFQNDVGLLACQYANGIQLKILNGETNINFGAVYENAVAQELHTHGYDLYYFNSKKLGELDFVVEQDGVVMPIEVKSGKDYRSHRALTRCLACPDFHLQQAIVLCNDNLQVEGNVVYAPIYMTMFLQRTTAPAAMTYRVDLQGLQKS